HETWATFRSIQYDATGFFDSKHILTDIDVLNSESLKAAFAKARPDAVVNCIGIVKQLAAAKDPLLSITINSLFPHQLASLCIAAGAQMIHISTDCVFSGRQSLYSESDIPDAPDLYGRSKLLGEIEMPGCVTLRTSAIGREIHTSHGLLEWFLQQRDSSVQ